ncbi:PREDICTED: separase isoform X2 [Tarenaya hassleriana]|uniref:separase isoform X2 n=1 Tax=Tarenaya hassleriana TaxID=28532 RepID=UPI00053C8468|nr:PREDICTED: separase isoform X2 [Tarenaya hassleriana]
MASRDEVRLLSLVESSGDTDAGKVFSLFSEHLQSFSDLSTPRKQDRTLAVRSLAKQFLPFLNKSLSLLPKRLSVANPDRESRESADDLFRTYELCLDCLELVSTQLACKPHTVQLQRLRMIYCLETWGLYEIAYAHGFRVLANLGGSNSSSRKRRCLPEAKAEHGGTELAMVVVEVVAAIFKCVAMGQEVDSDRYRTVLLLLEEVKPWFRILDANAYEKLHRVLATNLGRCTISLFREVERFDENLVHSFCGLSIKEYFKSPLLKDRAYKFSREVLSFLFAVKERKMSLTVDISVSLLRSVACEFQVETDESWVELVDLISYCAHKFQGAEYLWRARVSKHLNEIASVFSEAIPHLNMIVRLYSAGLSIGISDFKLREGDVKETTDDWQIRALLDDEDRWQNLVSLLGLIESCNSKTNVTCTNNSKKTYELPYVDALKFLCLPLADLINSMKRKIVLETEFACPSAHLSVLQEVFLHCCDGCLFLQRSMSDKGGRDNEHNKTMLNVAMAAFILSLRTQLKVKISACLVEDVISSPWIRPQELKYLFVSLYNIGVVLYRNKQLKKACKVLKLCFRASWTCVQKFCQMFVNQSNSSEDCQTEEAIIDFVGEACNRYALYLDILQQCSRHKLKKKIVLLLENWSAAGDLITELPGPMAVVRHWVKMECRRHENLDPAKSCTTLYSLLSSSQKFSRRTMGKILEQELFVYEELFPSSSNRGLQMQMETADILLKDVYVTVDMHIERARILIWKARMNRTSGTERLRDCIQCLSEAISILGDVYSEPTNRGSTSCHQLPVAYCLRALCIQETEPNSKQVFQDISASLSLWLSIPNPVDRDNSMLPENMIPLLYNIIDLMSMKGCSELHHQLYQLIFKLFKWKNVKMEVCLAMLWEFRRLNHALCPSTISDAFILSISEYCGENSLSVEFWMDCLKESKAKSIGFLQNFHFLHYDFFNISNKYARRTFQPDITIDDIKNTASELLSSVPPPSHPAFAAAYLYYYLCERLIMHGKFSEALSYAKEAHRIRTLSFQETFKYTAEKQSEKHNNAGRTTEIRVYGIKSLEVVKSIATDFWPCGNFLWDINRSYLSPWNVLQCYLESTLQVGVVNELIGNGAEAETLLSWGKAISCSQSLSPFVVAFSSALGNLYHKKLSLDLAAKELQSAKELLLNNQRDFSCLKCRLMLEAKLDQQLGDLTQRQFDSAASLSQIDRLSHAESLFSSALSKISCSAWKSSSSRHAEANFDEGENGNNVEKNVGYQSNKMGPSIKKALTANRDTRRGRRAKNSETCLSKDNNLISKPSSRITRSMRQSLKEQCQSCSASMDADVSKKSSFSVESVLPNGVDERESILDAKSTTLGICICNNGKCLLCCSEEVMEFGSLNWLTRLEWEFCYRRIVSTTLVSLGKCLADSGKVHQAHEALLQSIFVLFNSNHSTLSPPSIGQLLDFIGKELTLDVFAVERASILYNTCWLSLQNYHLRASGSTCCELSHIPFPNLVVLLKLAFVLSREVPILFQKVSSLLAALYLLAASSAEFSLQCTDELSASHWVSYFHQASLGTHISFQFFSNVSRGHMQRCQSDKEFIQATGSCSVAAAELDLPRLAPDRSQDLLQFVKNFFNNLSSPAIICISLLGGALSGLLRELMQISSPVCAWLLLSRLNSKSQPVAVLLPVVSVLEDISDDNTNPRSNEEIGLKDLKKQWLCPWGSTVVDDVAPAFKSILEENYFSSSQFPAEDTKENRCLWWKKRKKLDNRLGKFLRNLEDSWLGPWRHMLLGELSNCKLPDIMQKKLLNDLRSKCKMEVNEMLLKVILGGGTEDFKGEACIAQLCLKNGCYVGRGDYFDEEDSCTTPTSASNVSESRHGLALQLIHEAATKLELHDEGQEQREPIILVLDPEVQMLPWENIPVLRRQEVYRMPCVGSISAVQKKRCLQGESMTCHLAPIPLIDPLDAFYLLNPGGDLSDTQVEFESWFKDQNLEGKAGSVPTAQELTEALKNHDLFLYFGHGSGAQYISRHEIENLENCAATFLMGCSSGSLWLKGCYIPQGIPLSYLLASSPAIVANLWDVTDRDIDRFGKAMLEGWLKERSSCSENCSSHCCNSLADELAAMDIKGNTKKPLMRKKKPSSRKKATSFDGSRNSICDHKGRTIGSFMAGAREACMLPFLIGAAPVCYGVPTGIRRKKDLKTESRHSGK